MSDDLVYRLRKRAEIRRQISTRKSVQEGKPDRIADLLEEAAEALEESANSTTNFVEPKTPVQQEQEPVGYVTDSGASAYFLKGVDLDDDTPLYTAPPKQPEQEAFTLDRGCWERGCMAYDWRDGDGVNISAGRVDETAKHKHEPVAWLSLCYTEDGDPLGYTAHEQEVYGSFPVYTNPVGLTDEQIYEHEWWDEETAFAVNKELKEKNHAD
jgi:hypothetical protein